MTRKEILKRIEKYVSPFRITKGKDFRLKDFDPGDTCGLKMEKGESVRTPLERDRLARRKNKTCLCTRPLVAAASLPGDGCGRQRRHNQTCHVRRKSSGLPSMLVQAAVARGSRSRLLVALRQEFAGARADRDFQPVLLRRSSGRARARRDPQWPKAAAAARGQTHLGRAACRTSRISRITSRDRARSFSSSFSMCRARSRRIALWSGSTNRKSIGSSRPPTCLSANFGRNTCTLLKRRSAVPHRSTRLGMSYQPTTNGSAGLLLLRLSWPPWKNSISHFQKSTQRRKKSWRPRALNSHAGRSAIAWWLYACQRRSCRRFCRPYVEATQRLTARWSCRHSRFLLNPSKSLRFRCPLYPPKADMCSGTSPCLLCANSGHARATAYLSPDFEQSFSHSASFVSVICDRRFIAKRRSRLQQETNKQSTPVKAYFFLSS